MKKLVERIIASGLILTLAVSLLPVHVDAAHAEARDYLSFTGCVPCTITNAEGETLVYDGEKVSDNSTMEIYSVETTYPVPEGPTVDAYVKKSDSFTYCSVPGYTNYIVKFSVPSGIIYASEIEEATIARGERGRSSAVLRAHDTDYNILLPYGGTTVKGHMSGTGTVSMTAASGFGGTITGAEGYVEVYGGAATGTRYYAFPGVPITFSPPGPSCQIGGAVYIPYLASKSVKGVRVHPAPGGGAMLLVWGMVEHAMSYRVQERVGRRWATVAVTDGPEANWALLGAPGGAVRRYRVRAYYQGDGIDPIGRYSYEVSAAPLASAGRANATAVKASRKRLSGKAGGGGKRLKAKVLGAAGGKRLVSRKVRWYSSDAKVARVGRKSGKVTFRKRGSCEIWAKAHNGFNSGPVKVTVR